MSLSPVISRGAYWLRGRTALPGVAGWLLLLSVRAAASVHPDELPRDSLPEYRIIPAAPVAELTPANGWPAMEDYSRWDRSHGGPTSSRFSTHAQITTANVARLEVAWTYNSGDGTDNLQCNPIVVDGVMYAPTGGRNIVALNAATGRELWRFTPEHEGQRHEDKPARRGLLLWRGDGAAPPRLLFTAGYWIYALDPKTGKRLASFGEGGRVSLPTGGSVGGAVYRRVYVVPGFFGDVFGYDVITGRQLWRFYTVPREGEFGAGTWRTRIDARGANCWAGMALDESRGIAYVATGSPKPNFMGPLHLGDNLFANCVLALNAETGERIWHFQEVRHDIWDLDLAAPPNLVTVMREGKKVDAVAQVTKVGNVLLLDRVTGQPLFPFRLRRAPASTLPGEVTAAYQPDPELPEPLTGFELRREDITDRTPAARAAVEAKLARAVFGWYEPQQFGRPVVYRGPIGGADWPGAAFDPRTGRLYVAINHHLWLTSVYRDGDPAPVTPMTAGERAYRQHCAVCHGANRLGLGLAPAVRGLRHHLTDADLGALLERGRGAMPPMPQVAGEERAALLDFLFARDRGPATPPLALGTYPYTYTGYGRVVDDEGYPACKPPWGELVCLDLNTGRTDWRVPLGEHAELTKLGIAKTGTENLGGATVTATGIVFCGGTKDSKLRAFDAGSGAELWAGSLPGHGTTPVTTYEVEGRQFVVIACSGGGQLKSPPSDAWVAFALPKSP
jgi:quinoprotein glucose dehydrogenase